MLRDFSLAVMSILAGFSLTEVALAQPSYPASSPARYRPLPGVAVPTWPGAFQDREEARQRDALRVARDLRGEVRELESAIRQTFGRTSSSEVLHERTQNLRKQADRLVSDAGDPVRHWQVHRQIEQLRHDLRQLAKMVQQVPVRQTLAEHQRGRQQVRETFVGVGNSYRWGDPTTSSGHVRQELPEQVRFLLLKVQAADDLAWELDHAIDLRERQRYSDPWGLW